MSLSLVEALGQVELEAGQVYRCRVKDHWIELRVLGPIDAVSLELDTMLEPWIELPAPHPMACVIGELGPSWLPDVPEIPMDDNEA